MRVSILHWNRPAECLATIAALRESGLALKLTVVDNQSAEENLSALEAELPFDVELMKLPKNVGWGPAHNFVLRRWLKEENSEFCIVAAHDALPQGNCLRELSKGTRRASAKWGMVCPEYGEPARPTYHPVRGARLESVPPRPAGSHEDVEFCHGTLAIFRRKCLEEIGVYDEGYFAYTAMKRKSAFEHANVVGRSAWFGGRFLVNPGSWERRPGHRLIFGPGTHCASRTRLAAFSGCAADWVSCCWAQRVKNLAEPCKTPCHPQKRGCWECEIIFEDIVAPLHWRFCVCDNQDTASETSSPMKILISSHFFAPSVGGIEQVSGILAEEFTKMGHDVKVVTITPAESEPPEQAFEVCRRPSIPKLFRLLSWCDTYLQSNISGATLWPALLLRKPTLIVYHTWLTRVGGKIGWRDQIKRQIGRMTAKNMAVSDALAKSLFSSCDVIPNPYGDDLFSVDPKARRDRELVFLGRLVTDKGVDLLMDAMTLLRERGLTPHFEHYRFRAS